MTYTREEVQKLFRLYQEDFTVRQQQIISLYYFHGYSQQETADLLGVGQTTIVKHLTGNLAFTKGNYRQNKSYGGVERKLKKLLERDGIQDEGLDEALLGFRKTRGSPPRVWIIITKPGHKPICFFGCEDAAQYLGTMPTHLSQLVRIGTPTRGKRKGWRIEAIPAGNKSLSKL